MTKFNFQSHKIVNIVFSFSLARFLFVSGLNTLFGYGLFALLIYMKIEYQTALLMSTILGVLFNFKTTGSIVFGNGNVKLIFRFIFVYAIIYIINLFGLKILISKNFNIYISMLILLTPMALLSFILNKKFVFHDKK
jgi:putative flippase GtrA